MNRYAMKLLRRRLSSALLLAAASAAPLLSQSADLAVTKDGPLQSPADSDVSYSVSVLNTGPDDASAVTLSDPIPAGMTFVSQSGPVVCSAPAVGSGGTVSCAIGSLPAGSDADFTFVFHIAPATPPGTFFTNIATADSGTPDPTSENDSGVAVTSTPPPPAADMAVVKDGPATAGPDTDVTYTIAVINNGPDGASGVTLQDTLPGDMTFVSLGQSGDLSMVCSTPGVGSGGLVSCSAASFPSGATVNLTLVGHIPSGTPSGTVYTNSATVSAETDDPTPENDTSTTSLTVSAVDVSVTKSGPQTAMAGTDISYVLTVSNAGPDAASAVQLTDALPAGTTFVSINQDTGPTATCETPAVGENGTVICLIPTLPSGASAQLTLVVNTGSAVSISNTASVSTASFDTSSTNNTSAPVNTTVTQSADPSVVKSGPKSVTAGSNVTYTVTAGNAGPSNATGVTLTDVLPPGTTFVALEQTSGPDFTCTTPAAGAAGTITCSIATLPAGASAAFTIVLRVASTATGPIDNTASIASATPDPDPDNGSSTAPVEVLPALGVVEIPALSPAGLALLGFLLAAAALFGLRRQPREPT